VFVKTGRTGPDWQTERRLRALALYQKGWQQKTIAEALGVTKGAVSQWLKKVKDLPDEQQTEALTVKRSTGRKPALTAEDQQRLAALVDRGAESFGFVGDVWTSARVRAVARKEMGMTVGLTTIKKFLHEQGFSSQKPEVEASQKNAKAVAGFRGGWHRLKKGQSEQRQP
jgi:transposase